MEYTFELKITGTDYGELQGHIRWEGDLTAEFQSVLELMKILCAHMDQAAVPTA